MPQVDIVEAQYAAMSAPNRAPLSGPQPPSLPGMSFDSAAATATTTTATTKTGTRNLNTGIDESLQAIRSDNPKKQHIENPKEWRTWAEMASASRGKSKAKCEGSGDIDHGNEIDHQRLVAINGLSKGTTLRKITAKVTEGPLMSVTVRSDQNSASLTANLIFFQAENARAFMEKNQMQAQYGFGVDLCLKEFCPDAQDLTAMEAGTRRRLTFSGKGLYHRVKPVRFRKDVAAVVGESNIELIWTFNKGNGTVVLASIQAAQAVRKTFQDLSDHLGPYEGVSVTFSTDMCERELILATIMHEGGEVKALSN